jgi:hypothetical protein
MPRLEAPSCPAVPLRIAVVGHSCGFLPAVRALRLKRFRKHAPDGEAHRERGHAGDGVDRRYVAGHQSRDHAAAPAPRHASVRQLSQDRPADRLARRRVQVEHRDLGWPSPDQRHDEDEAPGQPIDCLPEVVQIVGGRTPVLVDGGFRRGTDVFKALALGARAICIGRPWQWGVSAFGQSGVEAVLSILQNEFHLAMSQSGTRSIAEIGKSSIVVGG